MKIIKSILLTLVTFFLFGCVSVATTTVSGIDGTLNENVEAENYQGLKRTVAISRFSNETEYAKGAFYDKENDPVGRQAVDILSAKLAATGKFILFEREDLEQINLEAGLSQKEIQKIGADYLIVGSITEFGRKTTGEVGLFTKTKKQTVEAGVNIRLVDVSTGQIVYSEEGKGEAETETSTTFGFGGQAGYDATLSDKAISAAIEKLVENIEKTCLDRPWKSYFLSFDSEAIIIAGGVQQGLKNGQELYVYTYGKKVKNPQTGMLIELPGEKVGKIKVLTSGGTTVSDEYSFVSVVEGNLEPNKISSYFIQDK